MKKYTIQMVGTFITETVTALNEKQAKQLVRAILLNTKGIPTNIKLKVI